MFKSAMAGRTTMEKVRAPNKDCKGITHVFHNRLRPISNLSSCASSPCVREPISIAIPFGLLRKKRAMMQKANVSHGKVKMDKVVRRRELPCIRRLKYLHRVQDVRCEVTMLFERKK
jgi:hypothetical protein